MAIPEEINKRIYELNEICYGLPSEAERALLKLDPGNARDTYAIADRWKADGLPVRKKAEVLASILDEAFEECNRDYETVLRYVQTKTTAKIDGKRITRVHISPEMITHYAKKRGVKLVARRTGWDTHPTKKIGLQIRAGINRYNLPSKKRFAFGDTPETI